MEGLFKKRFADIDMHSLFFNSLRTDYVSFNQWFEGKRDEDCFVYLSAKNEILGFLYLKKEDEALNDIEPQLPQSQRLKVGTFKVEAHGTRIGERLIKKIFEYAISEQIIEIYVTVFPKYNKLVDLFKTYGFYEHGKKGKELVLVRKLDGKNNDVVLDYPLVHCKKSRKFIIAIFPKYHSKLFPNSILTTEKHDIVNDVSFSNSIHKIFVSKIKHAKQLQRGDIILFYRTTDHKGPAKYRSVLTSLGVVEEIKENKEITTFEELEKFCNGYTVFTKDELREKYANSFVVIKFLYNVAFPRKIIRKDLVEKIGIPSKSRCNCIEITDEQFQKIITISETNSSYFFD